LWSDLINGAKPVVVYVIEVATEGLDMEDAKAKTVAAQQVLPLIHDVFDPVEREHYRQLLARRLRIDERVLLKVSPSSARRRRDGQPSGGSKGQSGAVKTDTSTAGLAAAMRDKQIGDLRRVYFLRQCLGYPQLIGRVDRHLAMNQQAVVGEFDFPRPEDRAIWSILKHRSDQWPIADEEDLWDSLADEVLEGRMEAISSSPLEAESELNRLSYKLVLYVLDWRSEQIKNLIDDVRQLLEENKDQETPDVLEFYNQQLKELPPQLLSINKARGAMTAIGRRQQVS
jgi:DNA primase